MRPDYERSRKAMYAIASLNRGADFTASDLLVGALLFVSSITAINPHDAPPDIQAIDTAIMNFLNNEFPRHQ